ncbi:hypothetical protein [Stratiformator vulcanicus]|uniref:Uncharacterized protein n=1 Tax=Stratiformator vulcanicus TaxID=2527980 RepID=A0A517R2Q3_9PLAN|nr:hypothetical protein [Stratiformator vulcanicus]QDT38170.1 hypothetical protein Pan189_25600 [Stratiformator vulcanicus]
MLKMVGVYLLKEKILCCPLNQATTKLWFGSDNIKQLPTECDSRTLGQQIIDALNESHQGMPHPTDFSSITKPLLEAAGVRSAGMLHRKSTFLSVEYDGSQFVVEPHVPNPDGGVVPDPDAKSVFDSSIDPEVLGREILKNR